MYVNVFQKRWLFAVVIVAGLIVFGVDESPNASDGDTNTSAGDTKPMPSQASTTADSS